MEIVQRHLQDALRHGHACGFLYCLGVVFEEEPGQQKRGAGGDDAPSHGFGQVANAGFFRVGHGLIACRVLDAAEQIFLDGSVSRFQTHFE